MVETSTEGDTRRFRLRVMPEALNPTVPCVMALASDRKYHVVVQGDITQQEVNAIVRPASNRLRGRGSVTL